MSCYCPRRTRRRRRLPFLRGRKRRTRPASSWTRRSTRGGLLTPTLAGPFGTLRSPRTGAKKAEAEAKKAEAKTKAMEVQLEAVKKMKEEKAKQKEMLRMMAALQTPSPKPCAKEGKTAEEVILHATPVSVKQSTEATDDSTPEASYQSGSPPPSTGHTVQMMSRTPRPSRRPVLVHPLSPSRDLRRCIQSQQEAAHSLSKSFTKNSRLYVLDHMHSCRFKLPR